MGSCLRRRAASSSSSVLISAEVCVGSRAITVKRRLAHQKSLFRSRSPFFDGHSQPPPPSTSTSTHPLLHLFLPIRLLFKTIAHKPTHTLLRREAACLLLHARLVLGLVLPGRHETISTLQNQSQSQERTCRWSKRRPGLGRLHWGRSTGPGCRAGSGVAKK